MPCVGRELRMLCHERMREIWEPGKAGSEPEDEEERQACRALKDHKELHNIWESADVIDETVLEYPPGGVNPFVHIAFRMIVEAQIEKNDPQGIREIAYSLESKGISWHEIVPYIMVPIHLDPSPSRAHFSTRWGQVHACGPLESDTCSRCGGKG